MDNSHCVEAMHPNDIFVQKNLIRIVFDIRENNYHVERTRMHTPF